MSDAAVQPVKNAAGPTDVVTNAEIFKHYFPKSFHQPPCNLSNTLNSSGEKPGKLSFIKVFEHGARTWEASGTLYMKSNLSLLPPEPTLGKGVTDVIDNKSTTKGAEVIDTLFRRGIEDGPHLEIFDRNDNIAGIVIPEDFDDVNDVGGPVKDYSPGEHDPIALFMSVDEKARTYRFGGWYKISHIAVYAKETRGVSDMLEERWALLGWDQSSKSLMAFQRECERDWARVEFTKMDPMDKNCPPPLVIGKPATRAKSTKRITSPKIKLKRV
ncbi:hypothetical protein P8C59_005962 [Phyllachora maydis]|uniref:Uncharacterized protein n=1 Tax=Phyllachora maydis TaxID=1825666 RepID=A0AAD9I5W0_9PEZI|nr:hypothetical protein P8C59_005962 [Phyllachora maydis]